MSEVAAQMEAGDNRVMDENIDEITNVGMEAVDANERRRALNPRVSVAVEAPAGSGKTELLTQRYLALLDTVADPESVVAITFTVAAATEMRERVIASLQMARGPEPADPNGALTWRLAKRVLARDESRGWGLETNPQRYRIMTIDKLNALLAGQYPILSELGGPTNVEERVGPTYERAVLRLLDTLNGSKEDEAVLRASVAEVFGFSDNRLDLLMEPLVAMLGKREQWLSYALSLDSDEDQRTERVLKALVEDRLRAAGGVLDDGTKQAIIDAANKMAHSEKLAWDGAVTAWPAASADQLPVWRALADLLLTSSGGTLYKKLTARQGWERGHDATKAINGILEGIWEHGDVGAIEKALGEVRILPDANFPEELAAYRDAVKVTLALLEGHLRKQFQEEGIVDFPEVAQRAIAAMSGHADEGVGAAMERMDYAVKHLLVDEFQDTSEGQVRLIHLLTKEWEAGGDRSLFLVGDPQQSIYGFRKAEVRLMLEILEQRKFHQLPLEIVRLEANFRSDEVVVDWFNRAFEFVFPKKPDLHSGAVSFSRSVAHRESRPDAGVHVHPFFGDAWEAEAAQVAEVCKERLETSPDESIAVLAATRNDVKAIIPALKEAGVDFSCREIDPLAATDAVKDVVATIRAAQHPLDFQAWVALLRAPFVGLSYEDVTAIRVQRPSMAVREAIRDVSGLGLSLEGEQRVARLNSVLEQVEADHHLSRNLPDRAKAIWLALGGPSTVSAAAQMDVERTFERLAEHCEGGHLVSLDEFEKSLDRLYASPEAGRVEIMTIHGSKGLQFDTVLLVGMGRHRSRRDEKMLAFRSLPEGVLIAPNVGRAGDDESPGKRLFRYLEKLESESQRHERERLLYVAVTRAKKQLHCFTQASINDKGDVCPKSGSFASMLWPMLKDAYAGVSLENQIGAAERPVAVPMTPRLPVDCELEVPRDLYVPVENQAILPSERAISDREHETIDLAHRWEQLVGTMYHKLVERIGKIGDGFWVDGGESMRPSLEAGFRRQGLSEPEVPSAVDAVIKCVNDTLADEVGRWILESRDSAGSEVELSGYMNGRWVAAVIDRTFVEDGVRWIVDYKAGGVRLSGNELARFVDREKERYTPQLERYKAVAASRWPEKDIRLALYFAASQGFVEIC